MAMMEVTIMPLEWISETEQVVRHPHYFILLGVFKANILLAVTSSSLQTIKPPHNKDPTSVYHTKLSAGDSH